MRALVTGGAGFIGSHLAERLAGDGHEVVCLDDLSTGRLRNLERLLPAGRATFVRADVIEALPVEGPFDQVYHLASPVSAAQHTVRPIRTLRAGAEGTRRCLDLAASCGATFVMASTSEVYGDPAVHPQVETYTGNVDPVGVRGSYNEAKRYAEALVTAYGAERGLKVRIARIFNTYGPRMRPDDGRVVADFIVRALAGRPLRVFGSGGQTRSFCYVSDMVEALVRLAACEEAGGPVNLGNPDEVRILDLAREVIARTGSRSEVAFAGQPPGDPQRRRPDITLARRLLGWEPRVPRADGLDRTIAYCRDEEPIA